MTNNANIEAILKDAEAYPWWRLTHCRGLATDVPKILRDLVSDDEDVRVEAETDGLYDRLSHQYTVYPASFHAAPFLLRLQKELPPSGLRRDLLRFIEQLAKSDLSWRELVASVFGAMHTWDGWFSLLLLLIQSIVLPVWILRIGLRRPNMWALVKSSRSHLEQMKKDADTEMAQTASRLLAFCDDPDYYRKQAVARASTAGMANAKVSV